MPREHRSFTRQVLLVFAGAVFGAGAVAAWSLTRDAARIAARPLPDEPWIRVTASEPLLRAMIADGIQRSSLRGVIEDVRVDARPGELVVQGSVSFLGRRLTATAVAHPHVVGRRLGLGISDLRIGRLTIPLGTVAEDAIARRLDPLLRRAALVVTGVELTAEGATVTARRDVEGVNEQVAAPQEWPAP